MSVRSWLLGALPFVIAGEAFGAAVLKGIVALDPARASHVNPRYPGVVREVFKSVGDAVTAGERLALVEGNAGLQVYPLAAGIDGVVIQRNVAVGEFVGQEDVTFSVADLTSLIVEVTVRQVELDSLKTGQMVTIKSRDKAREAKSTVALLPPTVDEHSRAGKALVKLENGSGIWRPGQMVDVYIDGEAQP